MAFENLSEKLQSVFKNLRGKGLLTEKDVDSAMKEVKMALLEADVNFKVVKQFVNTVKERAVGEEVMKSLTPGQQVIKIVNEELTELMGGTAQDLILPPTGKSVILMVGLQGSGKTTTAAKLAAKLKSQGKRPLLVGCDIYRPAAIEQLKINGEKVGVPVFEMGTNVKASVIAKAAYERANENNNNVIIIDTAGRLQIDEELMAELEEIKNTVEVKNTLLVVDAMTGQDAVNIAKGFNERIGVNGVILTKLDGDTRGGSALSVRAVTGVPILFAGMGEKLTDLEVFHPDRMAGRILGMGDVLTMIEKASETIEVDEDQAKDMMNRFKKNDINFEDYLTSMKQMKQMGGLRELMKMMPGMGGAGISDIDEDKLNRIEAIINSMTLKERKNPKLLNPSRKHRIAKGAGVDIADVNRLVKQFEQAKKNLKQMGGLSGLMGGRKGLGGLMGGRGKKGFF